MNKKLNSEEQEKRKLIWFLWLHDYFQRYYNKKTSKAENEIIERWNPEGYKNTPFKASEKQVEQGVENVWKNLVARYGISHEAPKPAKVFRLKQLIPYAAAVVVVGISMLSVTVYQYRKYDTLQSLAYVFSDEMQYKTANSDVKSFRLPDGSVITLNGNTTVTLVKNEFNGQQREVWLEDGEVFFDVAKNPEKLFTVHTPDAEVVVKGTSFNVTAYAGLQQSSVAVKTGKVEVIRNDKTIETLLPAKKIIIDKVQDKAVVVQTETQSIADWRTGNLTFAAADDAELVLRLEQRFDIKIEKAPGLLTDINLNASFEKDTSLETVLTTVADIYQIKYTINGKTVALHK